MKKTIGIIGGGNMGEALIKGLVEKKLFSPSKIFVCEADIKRAQKLKDKYCIVIGDLDTVIARSSTVILAVKPQDMENVLSQIKDQDKLFISIAAGLTTKFFEKKLGGKARVVRAMPNMPALIGEGMTAICNGRYATSTDVHEAGRILTAVGGCLGVEEKYMDAVTAVSGSGPAYVFLFVEQWIAAAISLGLNETDAQNLVYETLVGSAHLLRLTGSPACELRAKVTSKGGTTEAAMKVFFKGNALGKLMKDALSAAKKRSKELAK
jgi:pyrroline-5-carboxylate reductase